MPIFFHFNLFIFSILGFFIRQIVFMEICIYPMFKHTKSLLLNKFKSMCKVCGSHAMPYIKNVIKIVEKKDRGALVHSPTP